ncbi:MAG: efflux RND transporter permease subunit [Bacteroidales bacterium]|nr:efflux RND transporter permease subunit [Bacteroidales bacterium]
MLRHIIRRPVAVTMVVLVIAVLGIVAAGKLPLSLMPDIDIPSISIQIDAPQMSAMDIEESAVKPLREKLSQIGGLQDMVCESRDGSSTISMTFEPGTRMDYVFIETNEKVDQSMNYLSGISRPRVMKANASDIPAFYLNLYVREGCEIPFADFSSYVESVVVRRIEQLPQVAMVDVTGTVDKEIVITPDAQKLESMGMTLSQFSSYIRAANFRLGSLVVRDGEYHYNIKFRSAASGADEIADVWFKTADRLVQVRDVASVKERQTEPSGFARSDGKRSVLLAVVKQPDARMADLKSAAVRVMGNVCRENPAVDFTMTRDQTALLEFSIRNLFQNILLAILLSSLVIFLFLGSLRTSSLVVLTIPVSLLMTVGLFAVLGISLNVISLSGLILGVGMMVDNSIILVDNISRLIRSGVPREDAVVRGTAEVRGPMLSSVLTTCAVFLPLVFIGGTAGALFYDQAVAITAVLLSSYLVTITVLPTYYNLWGSASGRVRGAFLQRAYESVMCFCLRRRWLLPVVLVLSLAAGVFAFGRIGKQRLPDMSYDDVLVSIDWNDNISVTENSSRIAQIEQSLEAEQITSIIGVTQFILPEMGGQGSSEATIYLRCGSAEDLQKTLRTLRGAVSQRFPGAIVEESASGNVFESIFADREAMLVARLRPLEGTRMDVESLRGQTRQISQAVDQRLPEVAVKKDILYVADPELMALYGVSYDDILKALRTSLGGDRLFDITQGEHSIPVLLTSEEVQDAAVPVEYLLKQTFTEELKTVTSGVNGRYYPVSFDVPSRDVKSLMEAVSRAVRDDGRFDVAFSGSWFSTSELIRQMLLVLLISVLLLYLILAAQFESLVQPLIILSEIVIDIAFSLLALLLAGQSLNLMSLIGLVVICGIVINDSILKVDTINKLRAAGAGMSKAILQAGAMRFNAIVMTSLTTIFAALPFLSHGSMGNDLQFPMAFVIVAGMIAGTLVSLFFVPLMYSVTERRKK